MGEEKFASLSSGLLARKGAAKPAMRRQGLINPHAAVTEDLGWNDMGVEAPRPVEDAEAFEGEAAVPEVRKQQDQLAEGLNGSEYEPEQYKQGGLGGLSPMTPSEAVSEEDDDQASEPIDAEASDVIEAQELLPAEPIGEPVAEETLELSDDDIVDDSVRGHEQSPLSVKPANRVNDEPVAEGEDAVIEVEEAAAEPSAPVSVEEPRQAVVETTAEKPAKESVPARDKVAFTLRLDRDRHLKLRIASAILNQSAQRLVTEALDKFLEEHPEVQSIAGQSSSAKTH